jgi:phosphoribosylformylglycinamidine (FGAM) synthase-like enzyme
MSSSYLKLVAENPDKYPARMGQPWTAKETADLMEAIQNGELLKDIAILHERTVGGIRAQLCKIAADLHFKNKASIKDIMAVTGLRACEIENAIFIREEKMNEKDMRKKKADVGDLMREIGEIKKLLIELVEFKNKCIKKPVPQAASIKL